MAASCRTGRKDRTQLHDALLSRGPIAKTGATLRSVRKKLQGRVRGAAGDLPAEADERLGAASALLWWCDCNVNSEKRRAGKAPSEPNLHRAVSIEWHSNPTAVEQRPAPIEADLSSPN